MTQNLYGRIAVFIDGPNFIATRNENFPVPFSSINDILLSGDEVLTFGARAGNPYSVEIVNFFLKTVENRSKKGIKTKIIFNDDARDIGKTFELIFYQLQFD